MRGALFACAAAVAACHNQPSPSGPVANKAKPAAIDDLALLPVDSDFVVGVHWSQLQHSGVWQTYAAPKLASGDYPWPKKIQALCGFDPLAVIDAVTVGVTNVDGDNASMTVVVRGLDRQRWMTCFDKDIGDVEKDGSKVTIDGDVVLVGDPSGKHLGFTFVDDATALVIAGKQALTKDGLHAVARGAGSLRSSPTFGALYDKVNTHDTVWAIVNGNASVFKKHSLPFQLKALYGSVNVTDGVALDGRVRVGSPDEAASLVANYKGQLDQARPMFDKLALTAEGEDMRLAVELGHDKLAQLVSMVGAMVGGGAGDPPPPPAP